MFCSSAKVFTKLLSKLSNRRQKLYISFGLLYPYPWLDMRIETRVTQKAWYYRERKYSCSDLTCRGSMGVKSVRKRYLKRCKATGEKGATQ